MANIFRNALPAVRRNSKSERILMECFKSTWFGNLQMGPPDPILGVTEAYRRDENPLKVNAGVGSYRDDNGEPFVLPSVRIAEKRIVESDLDKEYTTIIGIPEFYNRAICFALGPDSRSLNEQSNATAQTVSGSFALRLGAIFLHKFFQGNREIVYMPDLSWANHNPIFEHTGFKIRRYRYYNMKTKSLDFQGFLEDINAIPTNSIVLLNVCAHNPTGCDPNPEQWCELSQVMKRKCLYPFFDMAYQGFATGDSDADAFPVRHFEREGHRFCLAQSFSKNMGLYGERLGTLTIIGDDKEEADRIVSQIKILIRPVYATPPLHGARIAAEVLRDAELKEAWLKDLNCMAQRIIGIRARLKENLIAEGSKRNWNHITEQVGMFCYTGMTPENVERLIRDFSIYLTKDGRLSMASVTSKNVEYLAKGIHEVTKE